MKVLLAGGGTAGHINPALAIAGYIKNKRNDAEFLFIGNRGGMEQRLVPQAGFDIKSITISGFKRSFSPKSMLENVKTVSRTFTSSREAKKIIVEFKPDICIGTGGYVSGPVISIDGRYQHIHAYGSYGDWFPQLVEEKGTDIADCSNLDIRPYIDNMPTCMAAADLVICRAGAITLSEIQAMGKPAILIPSPNVAENHQYHNAMALVNAGAADIIEEKDLTGAALMRKTDKMLLNPEKLEKYSENSRKMAITDANERIYSVVKKVLGLV